MLLAELRQEPALLRYFVICSRLAALFTGFVSGTVLRPRSPSEPYRDAFAASDADVNET
mgnify:CR=1 FL=1